MAPCPRRTSFIRAASSGNDARDLLSRHRKLIDAGFSYDQATVILEVLSSRATDREAPVSLSMQGRTGLSESATGIDTSHDAYPQGNATTFASPPSTSSPNLATSDDAVTSVLTSFERRLDSLELEVLKQVVSGSSSKAYAGALDIPSDPLYDDPQLQGIVTTLKPETAYLKAPTKTADSSLRKPVRYWGSLKGSALRSYNRSQAAAERLGPEEDEDPTDISKYESARAHGVGALLVLNATLITLFFSILMVAADGGV